MPQVIAGIRVPDSTIANAATQLVREAEDDLLYNHDRPAGVLLGSIDGRTAWPEI